MIEGTQHLAPAWHKVRISGTVRLTISYAHRAERCHEHMCFISVPYHFCTPQRVDETEQIVEFVEVPESALGAYEGL